MVWVSKVNRLNKMVTYTLEPVSYDVELWKPILHMPEPQTWVRKSEYSYASVIHGCFLCSAVRWVFKELLILKILWFKAISQSFNILFFTYTTDQQGCFETSFSKNKALNKTETKLALKIIIINFIVNCKLINSCDK